MSGDDGFLRRWSRLKEKTREEDETGDSGLESVAPEGEGGAPLPVATAAGAADAAEAQPCEAGPGDEASPEVELPDLESLTYESDYTVFLSEKVSDSVRNLALRKLWRSNPVLANLDGLAEYDDDFTDAATVIEGMKSAYQAGRGYLDRDAETPPEQEVAEAGEAEEDLEEETPASVATGPEGDQDQTTPPDQETASEPASAGLSSDDEESEANRPDAKRG